MATSDDRRPIDGLCARRSLGRDPRRAACAGPCVDHTPALGLLGRRGWDRAARSGFGSVEAPETATMRGSGWSHRHTELPSPSARADGPSLRDLLDVEAAFGGGHGQLEGGIIVQVRRVAV